MNPSFRLSLLVLSAGWLAACAAPTPSGDLRDDALGRQPAGSDHTSTRPAHAALLVYHGCPSHAAPAKTESSGRGVPSTSAALRA